MQTILVHGFTQTAKSWAPVCEALGDSAEVVCPNVPSGMEFSDTASWLGDQCGSGIYVGYSMGGRLCLKLALENPALIKGLVLVSTSPGIPDERAREARRVKNNSMADEIERDGVEAFISDWLSQPMFASIDGDPHDIDDRRSHDPAHLAAQLRQLGVGAHQPMWDRLTELRMPILIIVGKTDHKYCAIADAMTRRMGPNVSRKEIVGGHALPVETPSQLAEAIDMFTASLH